MLMFVPYSGSVPLKITNMFDINGDDTLIPLEARTLVAETLDGKWLATQCLPHEIVEVKTS